MNISDFSGLIRRFQNNELRGREQKMMEGWYDTLGNDADETAPRSAEEKAIHKTGLMDRVNADIARSRNLSIGLWIGIAASLIIVSLFFIDYTRLFQGTRSVDVVAVNKARAIRLPDGTRVLLEAGSTLHYPEQFAEHERLVTLTGAAFFDVSKDAARPFIITSGAVQTKVLGTNFSVRCAPSGDVDITVVTGRVAVSTNDNNEVILAPYDRASFSNATGVISKSVVDAEYLNSLVSARGYVLNFRDALLSEVILDFEAKFDVHFTFEDPALGACRFTGDFTEASLEAFLKMASQSLKFKYDHNGRTIHLRGKGCR